MRSTTSQVGGMKTASLPAAAGKRGFEGEGMRRHPSFIIITLKLFGYAWVLLGGNAHAQVRESPCSRIPTHPACSRKTFGRKRMHSSHSFLLRASGGAPSAPALTSLRKSSNHPERAERLRLLADVEPSRTCSRLRHPSSCSCK